MIQKSIAYLGALLMIACQGQDNMTGQFEAAERSAYLEQGETLVKRTFDSLRNTLIHTISTQGPEQAVRFCSLTALPLTSAFASGGVEISRITDKPRNPVNVLSDFDNNQFRYFQKSFEKGDSLKAELVKKDSDIHFYKPIIVQSMCLTCHGTKGAELSHKLAAVIDSLYPSDQAKGYREGDLRGMWHIVFRQEK